MKSLVQGLSAIKKNDNQNNNNDSIMLTVLTLNLKSWRQKDMDQTLALFHPRNIKELAIDLPFQDGGAFQLVSLLVQCPNLKHLSLSAFKLKKGQGEWFLSIVEYPALSPFCKDDRYQQNSNNNSNNGHTNNTNSSTNKATYPLQYKRLEGFCLSLTVLGSYLPYLGLLNKSCVFEVKPPPERFRQVSFQYSKATSQLFWQGLPDDCPELESVGNG